MSVGCPDKIHWCWKKCSNSSLVPRTVVPIAKSCHKISSINVISRVSRGKFHQIDVYFCFPRISFTLKSCQIVAGISTVRQFHEFLKSYFWRVFDIRPYCAAHYWMAMCVAHNNRRIIFILHALTFHRSGQCTPQKRFFSGVYVFVFSNCNFKVDTYVCLSTFKYDRGKKWDTDQSFWQINFSTVGQIMLANNTSTDSPGF